MALLGCTCGLLACLPSTIDLGAALAVVLTLPGDERCRNASSGGFLDKEN